MSDKERDQPRDYLLIAKFRKGKHPISFSEAAIIGAEKARYAVDMGFAAGESAIADRHSAERVLPITNPLRDCRDVVADASASVDERTSALYEWMASDADSAAQFICAELSHTDASPDWRNALVFAAEDATIVAKDVRQQVAAALRNLARQLRRTSEPGIQQVVGSAIRRYASLISTDEAPNLVEFLINDGNVDTRLVTIQSVVHFFESRPPQGPPQRRELAPLADRLNAIVRKLLDSDVLAAGEVSAIARQAICALAAMGDERVEEAMGRARAIGWRWFDRRVNAGLAEVMAEWKSKGLDEGNNDAFQRLSSLLRNWEQS